ncbi:hypothetical protein V7S43_004800 [Phytophthora oleae]|uniref:Uncharacterized protein n=1 Tax=Phytophthora oleae TaxID=2107226 RepID=A0ABD3FXU6_9STRA
MEVSDGLPAPHDLLSASTVVTTFSETSWQCATPPEASASPPDVMLHVGGCVFALHNEVLSQRWPWLHLQLQRLQEQKDTASISAQTSQLKLRLVFADAHKHKKGTISSCPLQTITLAKPLLYTKCLSAAHQHASIADEECSSTDDGEDAYGFEVREACTKRRRQESVQTTTQENELESFRVNGNKRARRLFDKEKEMIDVEMVEKPDKVAHVELVGVGAVAVVPMIEYVYTYKVRLLHATTAMETLRVAQWMGMGDRLRYSCVKVAVRQVTLDTWMDVLVATAALNQPQMRRNVTLRLVDFLYGLERVEYHVAMDKIKTIWVPWIHDHDMLILVVVALINNLRLVEFWRELLIALVQWLKQWFKSSQVPSLREMHHYFVTEWEPYVELPRVECFTNTPSVNLMPLHVTLFEFGDFVLQACINAVGSSPLLWRIIRRTSSYLFSQDSEVVLDSDSLDGDPEFWIRGQLIVKYQPTDRGGGVVTEETRIEYQHCCLQYCKWNSLVSLEIAKSARTTSPSDEGWVHHEDPEHNYYRRTVCTVSGNLFLWGDPICSVYHQLLQTTLFHWGPIDVGPEAADIKTVSEMQQLPIETLVLVLCSNRLQVPEGERTLLRCLNKMVFGLNVYHFGDEAQLPQPCSSRVEDVMKLYRCVRWCFVPLDDIMQTLRWAPRTLKLYEIVGESLRDPSRTHRRRRPFKWHNFRDAYMTNETNLSEFEIEAGDLHLAPSDAAPFTMLSPTRR